MTTVTSVSVCLVRRKRNVKLVDTRKVERSKMRRDKLLVASVLSRAANGRGA